MPKLPQVSGERLVGVLKSLGYEALRQRGSHISYEKSHYLASTILLFRLIELSLREPYLIL